MQHRTRSIAGAVLFAALSSLLAGTASAHHGWSDYDAGKTLTLKGRVQSSSYENPHATIVLDAQGHRYTVVLAPVSRMESRGASRESIAVGKEVTVVGYPNKSHPTEVRAERITVTDGTGEKTVELR